MCREGTGRSLSIVVIARNEERTIEACIAAALESTRAAFREGLAVTGEVILVDSASTDGTVSRASAYPITILELPPNLPLSAAAGRQVGFEHARGDLLYFIDGDTVVEPEWLPIALRLLAEPRVAAVDGHVLDPVRGESVLAREIYRSELTATRQGQIRESEAVCVGIYRRDAFDAAGGFHPFLRGAEDLDLGYRLKAKGWRLLRTPETLGRHYWSPAELDVSFIDYLRSVAGWSFGAGQACRFWFSDPSIRAKYLRRYATARFVIEYLRGLSIATWILLHAAALWLPSSAIPALLVMDAGLLLTADAERRSKGQTWREWGFWLHGPLYSIVRHVAFLFGFMTRTPPPSAYPREARIFKTGTELQATLPGWTALG